MDKSVSAFLAGFDPPIADLASQASEVILSVLPEAHISLDEQNIGFGTGTGYKGLVFTVAPHRGHVTLGVAHGASLPDPAGLLEGAGKVHRHVKLRTVEDLRRPELLALMREAIKARS